MSDLDKFIKLYKSLGIDLKPEVDEENPNLIRIELYEYDNPKLDGYSGFYTTIEFDADGKFIEQGFWE